jgi:MSHA pilin protein MshC
VRRAAGFTILEIIVVLLLMSIVGAVVLGRSITTANMDLNSATDQLRNHLRLAQADAMKRSDAVWGIKSSGSEYWLFRGTPPDNAANEVRLPGVQYSGTDSRVSEAQLKAGVSDFTVFFDRIGRPYSPDATTALAVQMTIIVSAGGDTRTITITPETGLIR